MQQRCSLMFRLKTPHVYILAACILQCAVFSPADCKPKNFRTLQLLALKEMREAVIASQQADDVMLKEIEIVASELERELARRSRMRAQPLAMRQSEESALSRRLSSKLGTNPYARQASQKTEPSATPKAETGSADELGIRNPTTPFLPCKKNLSEQAVRNERVKVVVDFSLPGYSAAELRKKVPEAWVSEPGDIMIEHNGHDLCLIWGAGVEGKPVFDRAKQRFKVVSIRLNPR